MYAIYFIFQFCFQVVTSVQTSAPTGNITYEIKPERLQQIQESPSGWVPPAAGTVFFSLSDEKPH